MKILSIVFNTNQQKIFYTNKTKFAACIEPYIDVGGQFKLELYDCSKLPGSFTILGYNVDWPEDLANYGQVMLQARVEALKHLKGEQLDIFASYTRKHHQWRITPDVAIHQNLLQYCT